MSLSRILNEDPQGQRHYRNGHHPYPAQDSPHPYYDHGPPRHHHHHPPAQQQEYGQHEYWDRNGHYDHQEYRDPRQHPSNHHHHHHPHPQQPVYRSPSPPTHAQHYPAEPPHHHASHAHGHHAHRHVRASSSDLEDCQEVWSHAVSEYALHWREKERAIEAKFDHLTRTRNDAAARLNAHRYADKLAALDQRNHALRAYDSADAAYRARGGEGGRGGYKRPLNETDGAPGDYGAKSGSAKRRRLDEESIGNGADEDELLFDDNMPIQPEPKRRGRKPKLGNYHVAGGTPSDVEAASTRSTTPRKGRGGAPGKRGGAPYTTAPVPAANIDSLPGTGTATPSGRFLDNGDPDSFYGSGSMPASPASGALVFEMDELIPPLPKGVKLEGEALAQRLQQLEGAQHKVWLQIARRDIPKAYRYYQQGQSMKVHHNKRVAQHAAVVARRQSSRPLKAAKENQARAKKVVREMMLFWRKNEKDERDGRKRAEREAIERARQEEERRESARQKRKLEFLISQTELYSHFVGNKLNTEDAGGEAPPDPAALGVLGADLDAADDGRELKDIDFDDADETNLHLHAKKNAQLAIMRAKQRVKAFDAKGKQNGDAVAAEDGVEDEEMDEEQEQTGPKLQTMAALDESEELNFQNPTLPADHSTVSQPKMLMTELKEYQLKGLNWLVGLYEQGINGILADEMGLGKTVQSIALLSYLAETHNIWGPFLVIAPSSTLHNWQQEITRFVPQLKALPYWGSVKERATLRKFWDMSQVSYGKDAQFHVLVSSYPLVLQDQQHLKKLNWQYMILDEAQAIKNSSSARWNTLLDFECRNRLLLTGTPIQNSMQELWALLHFIMPTLFDSLNEFSTWFTKDEDARGGGSGFNASQLRRLHMILRPFMLRRLKTQVQNELSEKIEIEVPCYLSLRQRKMYNKIRANVSLVELLQRANSLGDADSAKTLMNLVMQSRKVVSHPELFERAEVSSSFSMCHWARSGNLAREGDFLIFPYSARNPIEVNIPELFYKDGGLLDVPGENVRKGSDTRWLDNLMNIWSPDSIQRSLHEDDSAFSFLRLQDISPSEAHDIFSSTTLRRILLGLERENWLREDGAIYLDTDFTANAAAPFAQLPPSPLNPFLEVADGFPALADITQVAWQATCLSRPIMRWYSDMVLAPPIEMYLPDRTFVERQTRMMDSPSESLACYGLPSWLQDDPDAVAQFQRLYPGVPPVGLFGASPANQLPWSTTQVPEAKRLIYDSGKLARLDSLLQELKSSNHRVLIYFQMTKMIDLMEEYLVFRQYKYLRLDGSSKLEDRRDMVDDWQTRPDIFVFLLSTKAGGLGINLTAADTVIFYDHDWNPSNDAQAMDRAHRLGQTRQVTVYRLITRGTIDERIVQLARVKKEVQDAVVGNKQVSEVTKPAEIAQLLLNDDELANYKDKAAVNGNGVQRDGKAAAPAMTSWGNLRDAWVDEGDDFFGHSATPNTFANNDVNDDDDPMQPVPTASGRGKRGRGRGSRARGERGTRSRGRRGRGQRGSGVGGEP